MPIYEYECMDCHKSFSLLQSIRALVGDTKCQACGSNNVRRKMSSFSCSSSGASSLTPPASPEFGGG